MNTGLVKKEDFGKLVYFENNSHLYTWGDINNYCNSIDSVALFPPFVKKDVGLNVFVADICRLVSHN